MKSWFGPKNGAKTSESSLILAWGQFGPIEMGLFLALIFGLNRPNCKGPIGPCGGPIWEKYWGHIKIKRGQNGTKISALSQMTPLKIANSASMWGHYRSRGLSSLCADFPPYSQIMKIHLRLYLSNTHLLGSRYCLCKNLLHYLILQLLRILIVV